MPHVNLAFPFFDPSEFEVAHSRLQARFGKNISFISANFDAFEVTFAEFGFFDHGKNCVLWLRPHS